MNWKKILVVAAAASLAGPLGHYTSEVQQGHHAAFNFANIGAPAVFTLISTLAALFTPPPNKP